jgi:cytochrome c peroxidase
MSIEIERRANHPFAAALSRWVFPAILGVMLSLVFTGCSTPPPRALREELADIGIFSPRRLGVGNANLVNLGQLLFFDSELSGNRNMSCGTCHVPQAHAGDGRYLAIGEHGRRLWRQTLEPFNGSFRESLFWDGRVYRSGTTIVAPVPVPGDVRSVLEAQALLPMLDRDEMRGQPGDVGEGGRVNELANFSDDATTEVWSAIMSRLLVFPGYRNAFQTAYPGVPLTEMGIIHVARAIVAFELHLWELADSAFDRYLGSVSIPGDDFVLDALAIEGARLFVGDAGCVRCHAGPLLTDEQFHNIGVPPMGEGRGPDGLDEGRMEMTGLAADRFRFRTPPLRNVALTPPYMHNGAYSDLTDVIEHHLHPEAALARYDSAHIPTDIEVHRDSFGEVLAELDPQLAPIRELTPDEVFRLVRFLESLSSEVELTVSDRPGAGIPLTVPSGLPVHLATPDVH